MEYSLSSNTIGGSRSWFIGAKWVSENKFEKELASPAATVVVLTIRRHRDNSNVEQSNLAPGTLHLALYCRRTSQTIRAKK
jgi:hypothetical protein